jgi:hypothetical protein
MYDGLIAGVHLLLVVLCPVNVFALFVLLSV